MEWLATIAAECRRLGFFAEFRSRMTAEQPPSAQPRMNEEFEKLMKDITFGLDSVNRDRFQNRITLLKVALKEFAVIP